MYNDTAKFNIPKALLSLMISTPANKCYPAGDQPHSGGQRDPLS